MSKVNEINNTSQLHVNVIGGGVYLKNKPQNITITWEIKDDSGNRVIPDMLFVNNIKQDPTLTSKTFNRVFSDVDFTVRAVKGDIVAIGTTTARFVGPTQTVENSLDSYSHSIALSANQGRILDNKIENATNRFKGLFLSVEDLSKKFKNGVDGDWAIVGESIPAPIFIWNKNQWEASGGNYDGETVDLTAYSKKQQIAEYTDDYNVSKNHQHSVKVYDDINWSTVKYDKHAPVFRLGDSYDSGEIVNMVNDEAFSYKALNSTNTAPYLTQKMNSFTLEEAISFLPEDLRVSGQKISFYSSEKEAWMTYVFTGGDYTNPTYWEIFTNNIDPDTDKHVAELYDITDELDQHLSTVEDNLNSHITESNNKFDEIDQTLEDHSDRMDDIEDEILMSSVEAACSPKDVEILADRAYKDHTGKIIADEYVTRNNLTNEIIDITNQQVTDLKPGSVDPEDLSEATKQLLGNKNITNLPDEEDITVDENNLLKFKDKEYSPKDYSGMGRKVLRKHYVNGVNTLTQHMINKPNTIYIIQYDYCLADQTIEIPENCILQFEGGSFRNGSLQGSKTKVISKFDNVIFSNVDFSGSFVNSKLKTSQFGFISDLHTVSQYWTYKEMNIDIEVYTGTDNKSNWNNLNNFINNSYNIEIVIDGQYYTNSNWCTLTITNASNLKMHGGTIDAAFYFRGCHDIELYDIIFIGLHKPHDMPMMCTKEENISETVFHTSEGFSNLGITNEAIAIQTLVDGKDVYSYNFNIHECEFYMRTNGIYVGNNLSNTDTIKNVYISNCISDCIHWHTVVTHSSYTFVNNIFTYRNGQSIDISTGSHNVIVSNCKCYSDNFGPKQETSMDGIESTRNNELRDSYFNITKNRNIDLETSMLRGLGGTNSIFRVVNCVFESSADRSHILEVSGYGKMEIRGCSFIKNEGTTYALVKGPSHSIDGKSANIDVYDSSFIIYAPKRSNYSMFTSTISNFSAFNSKFDVGDDYPWGFSYNDDQDRYIRFNSCYLKLKTLYKYYSQFNELSILNSYIEMNGNIDISREGSVVNICNNNISGNGYIVRVRSINSNVSIMNNNCRCKGIIVNTNECDNTTIFVTSNVFDISNIYEEGSIINAIITDEGVPESMNLTISSNTYINVGEINKNAWIIQAKDIKNSFKFFNNNKYIGDINGYDTFPTYNYGYNPNPSDKDVYYDLEGKNFYIAFSGEYYDYLGNPKDSKTTGSTAERPTEVKAGFFYKDTTLNKPVWWDGSQWVDATGAQV